MILYVLRVPHPPPLHGKFLLILQEATQGSTLLEHFPGSPDYSLVSRIRDFISITTASQKIQYQRQGILEGLDKNHVLNSDLSKEFKL